jgi:hypothetical protein
MVRQEHHLRRCRVEYWPPRICQIRVFGNAAYLVEKIALHPQLHHVGVSHYHYLRYSMWMRRTGDGYLSCVGGTRTVLAGRGEAIITRYICVEVQW